MKPADTDPAAPEAPTTAGAAHPRRWLGRWRALGFALMLLLGGVGSGVWWATGTEAGSAWLLSRLTSWMPWIEVSEPRGALLGGFSAQRVQILLADSPEGDRVVISGLRWQQLQVRPGDAPHLWVHLRFAGLAAKRIEVLFADTPDPKPLTAPLDLALPLQIDTDDLRVDSVQVSSLGSEPLRDVSARLQLGAASGARHRIEALQLDWRQFQAQGDLQIDTQGAMSTLARIVVTQPVAPKSDTSQATGGNEAIDLSAWRAALQIEGPLASPALRATVEPAANEAQPAQSLQVQASVQPFANWPLAALQIDANGFDISTLLRQAPQTSLSGRATLQAGAPEQPISAHVDFSNSAAGLWNEGRLPLRRLQADVLSRSSDRQTLELEHLQAEMGSPSQPAGQIEGRGVWNAQRASLDLILSALQPERLDARAPEMTLGGPITLAVERPIAEADAPAASRSPTLDIKLDLTGALSGRPVRGLANTAGKKVQLQLDARLGALQIDLREAHAQSDGASASLSGSATRASNDGPWQLNGKAALVEFDPLRWWSGAEGSAWRHGPHRLNAKGEFDLQLPPDVSANPTATRGNAQLTLERSLLAGVPIDGHLKLASVDTSRAEASVELQIAGNRLSGHGRFATPQLASSAAIAGRGDQWDIALDAKQLAAAAPLWRLVQPTPAPGNDAATLAGALTAAAQVEGRWPDLRVKGELEANGLRLNGMALQQLKAHWQAGTAPAAALDIQVNASQWHLLTEGAADSKTAGRSKRPARSPQAEPSIESASLSIQGTPAEHRIELQAKSRSQPPGWTETLQPDIATQAFTALLLRAHGGLTPKGDQPLAGWQGRLEQLQLAGPDARSTSWLTLREVALEAGWSGGPAQIKVQPGEARVLGTLLRWSELSWLAAEDRPGGRPARVDAQMTLDPLPVAPLLERLQPDFGWGGDLAVGGRIDVHSAGQLSADIVLERSRGDLSVTDETGTQALGLENLRLSLNAQEGVWTFSPYLTGRTLGVLAGAVVVRSNPALLWPVAQDRIEGALELDVANLGAWGTWVPAGWRLGGQLKTSAVVTGPFGSPQFNGSMRGEALSVRNFVEGVNVSGGEVLISLQGDRARIEKFTANAGTGTLNIDGEALLGAQPSAQLQLKSDHFTVLGRVDRRIVTTGQAQLALSTDALKLTGAFTIDEGLIDFSRSDAPALSPDVVVVRSAAAAGRPAGKATARADSPPAAPASSVVLDVNLNLGEQLQLRGRGLDTGLRGKLQLSVPAGKLAINGTVTTAEGTYAAYGQRLTLDRGRITFNGPPENPRLSIEATRPNTDVRVGVMISGTAMTPRVRLFSEPELPEVDKLSWLVMGRASDGLGRGDTALLQTAAMALLSGEGDSLPDQLTKAIGIDEVSVKQGGSGDVRETVVALGKNLSRHWYVGYERGLNATAGSWQLIYRIARSFTLRAQSGEDNSLDVIWSWRWN